MKIYTKNGDTGYTSGFGGEKLHKSNLRIKSNGDIDELNSLIGLALSENPPSEISKKLERVQEELFVLGTDISTPLTIKTKIPRTTKHFITRLEKEIDDIDEKLSVLKNFILPGGSKVAAYLHLARAVARRAERTIAELSIEEKINPQVQIFLNRLSDWFFVLARYINKAGSVKEKSWKGR